MPSSSAALRPSGAGVRDVYPPAALALAIDPPGDETTAVFHCSSSQLTAWRVWLCADCLFPSNSIPDAGVSVPAEVIVCLTAQTKSAFQRQNRRDRCSFKPASTCFFGCSEETGI
jgi:hypothetical protein